MKKILIIGIAMFLIGCSTTKNYTESNYKKCSKDVDCIEVSSASCDCSCGGQRPTAINKNFQDYYKENIFVESQICTLCFDTHPICARNNKAVCEKSECVLKAK